MDFEKPVMSVAEFCRIFGVHKDTVAKMIRNGTLKAIRTIPGNPHSTRLILTESVRAWLNGDTEQSGRAAI